MDGLIFDEITRFVLTDEGNRVSDGGRYFDDPLVGFAAADDPLFVQYKTIIGDFHLTPYEMSAQDGEGWIPRTVICWILPIVQSTRESNRKESLYPSRLWAHTRNHGEAFNAALRRHLVASLTSAGHRALAPQLHSAWKELPETPVGRASTWSERHAAYAAGLGTFSLNDALITPAGIAHRCGTVITDMEITPSPRNYLDHRSNCLYFSEGTCGACIERCPVGALSKNGHDKSLCCSYVYGDIPKQVAALYQVTHTGCGLCQTRVPCEGKIPAGRTTDSVVA
jgi:epoxyqueuosine reductase